MSQILEKQKFLRGNRQRWAVIFLLWGGAILSVSMFYPHIEVAPFLSYGGMIGTSFILGMSVDSAIKTNSAAKIEQMKRNPKDYEDEK